ncbi:hypothetical protein RIF29_14297 [Crotalaria pallida]|uniref:Uncharacterized protein n=1 Tax=Crotalaria pallida TaxID=3830 RepID=A0AAN9IA64_CROPI
MLSNSKDRTFSLLLRLKLVLTVSAMDVRSSLFASSLSLLVSAELCRLLPLLQFFSLPDIVAVLCADHIGFANDIQNHIKNDIQSFQILLQNDIVASVAVDWLKLVAEDCCRRSSFKMILLHQLLKKGLNPFSLEFQSFQMWWKLISLWKL